MHRILVAAFSLVFLALAAPARADEANVHVELLSEQARIAPGQTFTVALKQTIKPEWHTYWANPGDSGTATAVEWKLPPGMKAGEIQWPAPGRIPYGPLVNYGYDNEAVLLINLTAPADAQPGSTVPVQGDVELLVCKDICIPEDATVSLNLPVGATPQPDAGAAKLFADARARLPSKSPFAARVESKGSAIRVALDTGDARQLRDLVFFPTQPERIDNAAPQKVSTTASGVTLELKRAEGAKQDDAALEGVLTFRDESTGKDSPLRAIQFTAQPGTVAAPAGAAAGGERSLGLGEALLFALLGGLILNLMPCVFPVLSMKALSLARGAHGDAAHRRADALAYTAGVLAMFTIIAVALLALRAGGAEIGWGFQLQSPLVVTALAYLLFAVGLVLSGVVSVGERFAGMGSSLAARGGLAGSFFTGALATIVATPCTAPFMAGALGFALVQPAPIALVVFEALGLGLALPYLLLGFAPALARALPKPGAWMERFRQFLAFPVYATVVWLVFVLQAQAGPFAATSVLAGLVLIGFAAWAWDAARFASVRGRAIGATAAIVAIVGALLLVRSVDDEAVAAPSAATAQSSDAVNWQSFSQARLDSLLAEGKPVFIDFTAAWCITCKVNETVALTPEVARTMESKGVVALRGDWTKRDAEITRVLQAHGRAGVPLYLYYKAGAREPQVLPQILTSDSVRSAMEEG
ncbi:MAG: thiol:disulfide interchange protein [Rhodospirillales bacterium]|nr:thiol:disulfide interchange protein [Rhodospirillales bacterium]